MAATNQDIIKDFLNRVIDGLIKDAQSKNQKIPVKSFRISATNTYGDLFAADYFKYLITGRGPGKFPPPVKMLEWVQSNPDVLARAKQVYASITEKGLAFLVGRKIAREGTDIYKGKKKGIDLEGVLEETTPYFLGQLAKNEAFKIASTLQKAVKV